MKFTRSIALVLGAALLLCCCKTGEKSAAGQQQEQTVVEYPMGFNPEAFRSREYKVKSGDTFSRVFNDFGMNIKDVNTLVKACDGTFDLRKFKADHVITVYYQKDADSTCAAPRYAVYQKDKIHYSVFSCSDSIYVWNYEKPVIVEQKIADVTIANSLWKDMADAGISPLLISDLSDIYAWTVNFFGLQQGDRFRVVYTQKVCDGEVVAIEQVHYAVYDSGDFHAKAIRFDQGDGGNKFWNEKGESLRKAFLKAPLKYNRISSKFTYHRKHPVTGKVRPHTAVDYAAPKGTPVHTIGDGTVTLCGWDKSGGGNRIKIKHMNGYETCYMHLQKFAPGIRQGSRVAQGQLIGYVGSTGTSTGPHLDFRVWKNGTPVDPLKMISPPAEPLRKSNLDSLHILEARYSEMLK